MRDPAVVVVDRCKIQNLSTLFEFQIQTSREQRFQQLKHSIEARETDNRLTMDDYIFLTRR